MSIITSPGSEITVLTIETKTEIGYFDERAPLGGVRLGVTTKTIQGVLVDVDGEKVRVMRLRRDGDFSGIVTEYKAADIVSSRETIIGDDHMIV
jgi:hypothetical protein